MGASGRHQQAWRQLHREVIHGLEEEVERLRIRDSELQQAAKEREVVLLELLEEERAARRAAEGDAGTVETPDRDSVPGKPDRGGAASARAVELLARLSLTDARIPELEAALRASEEELAAMRNRKAFRAIDALVKLKRRVLGRT